MECLGKDVEILMDDGSIKKVQNLVPGDQLLGVSKTCFVVTVDALEDELFKISYQGGNFTCNSAHILTLKNDIKIGESQGSVENFIVSFFCPAALEYKYQTFKNLRDAVLVKNFLIGVISTINITVSDYFTNDCKLALYAKYFSQDNPNPEIPFKITYSHHGECYKFALKDDAVRLR